MTVTVDHLTRASDLLLDAARSLAATQSPDLQTAALAIVGIELCKAGHLEQISFSDLQCLDAAHRLYASLLQEAIAGAADFDHVVAVLTAISDLTADEIDESEPAQRLLLGICWRCALVARRLGRPVFDKTAYIIGGSEDPNE